VLKSQGSSATVDNSGEFVFEKSEALAVKDQILNVVEAIHEHELDAHISLHPTQLGLDIDDDFCHENLREIVERAAKYDIFVNFDMEDYGHLQPSFDLMDALSTDFDNIETVIQSYFFRAK